MRVAETDLPGVLTVEPTVYADGRGTFMESFHAARYAEAGIAGPFVQDNVSLSRCGVVRGLHFQHPGGQGKLVSCLAGEVFDVAIDVRRDSPAFGRWVGVALSAARPRQLYLPPGFAHGFCALSDECVVAYKCTAYYRPEAEATIAWDDPDLAIAWPVTQPVLSAKDGAGRPLSRFAPDELPTCRGD